MSRHALVGIVLFATYLGYGHIEPWLDRQRAMTDASAKVVAQQKLLTHYEAVTVAINKALHLGMANDPALDRIRVAFMQAPASRDNLPLPRWDITHSLTKAGHTVGALATDLHVSDWSDYFELLLTRKCGLVNMSTMASEATLGRIREMHLAGFLVCPITTPRGELVGAVFGSWDVGSPEPPNLAATEATLREVADKIGTAVPIGG